MIRVLKADHRSLEGFRLRLCAIRSHRKRANSVEKSYFVCGIELNRGPDDAWIIKSADCNLDGATRLESERRAAFRAKTASRPVGTRKTAGISTSPFDVVSCYQRAKNASECLLAHAAVAD
jgi:hypothetical protein